MKTVLVVEDDPTIAMIIREVLEEQGYQVRLALDVDALYIARAERPAVILMDLNLPGADGVQISRWLRDDQRTRHIPIVLMSASDCLVEKARAAQADELLPKPFDITDLLSRVDDLASRQSA